MPVGQHGDPYPNPDPPEGRDPRTQPLHAVREGKTQGSPPNPPSDQPAERTFGYALALWRTRQGPRITSARRVLRSSAAEGALAGHTPFGQANDPGPKGAGIVGVAHARAAHAANLRLKDVLDDLAALEREQDEQADAERVIAELGQPIEDANARVTELEDEVNDLAARQRPPAPRAVPDHSEWPAIADEAVRGYRLNPYTRAAMFTSSAIVEAVFTGTYVSEVASIGIPGVPVEVNVNLPWAAGAAIGALIPAIAERAAHASATADSDAPWYVRRAPEITIAVPAALGIGRAITMAADDLLSGALGLAVALLLTALAVMAASVGFREGVGEVRDQRRQALADLREQDLLARTPGPAPEALELIAKRKQLDQARRDRDALVRRRDALRTTRSNARTNLARAKLKARAAAAASRLDAAKEGGLAIASGVTYQQRRDAIAATHTSRRPEAFDAAAWDRAVRDLPYLQLKELLPNEHLQSESDEGGEEA